jgi:hypothetical protein
MTQTNAIDPSDIQKPVQLVEEREEQHDDRKVPTGHVLT